MYEEIDRGKQAKWTPIILTVGFFVVTFHVLILFTPIGLEILNSESQFLMLVAFSPLASYLIGCFLGFMRKRAIRINTQRLEFHREEKRLDQFGSVYMDDEFRSNELGGNQTYACAWLVYLLVSTFIGVAVRSLFPQEGWGVEYTLIVIALSASSYSLGVIFSNDAAPISSSLVQNPLQYRITKYLSKEDALRALLQCDIISSIRVQYRKGEGQDLHVVDDVRALARTRTEPFFDIEVTIEDMEDIGPEYSMILDGVTGDPQEKTISVDDHEARFTSTMKDSGFLMNIRYDMNTIRARWALGQPKELCNLMYAFLEEMQNYVSISYPDSPKDMDF